MWIEISKDIFEDSDIKGLSYIFQILSWYPKQISRYNVFIDLDEIKKTDNYVKLKGIDSNFDEFIENQFNEFILTNSNKKNRDYIISNNKSLNSFNIEESIRFFNQPISIILENNKNDAYFIKAIFNHIDSTKVLTEHVENGWIKFENAGGCSNVRNFIEGELKSFEDLASRNNKHPYKYYRSLVLLDSDKEFLLQPQKQQYNNLVSFLQSIGLDNQKYHILEKRMMENYMPDEVFEELKDSYSGKQAQKSLLDWINVYLNLNDEQKDYLNFKNGFPKEYDEHGNKKPISISILNLYNIPERDYAILDGGFKFPDFKNSFSELFYKSTRVNKSSMLNRAKSKEFDEIIDKIYKLV